MDHPELSEETVAIEVVYALKARQRVVALDVAAGTTAREAAVNSGLDRYFPELALNEFPLGVYGERVSDEYLVADGDRIEIYRPLVLDPMEARRKRAAK